MKIFICWDSKIYQTKWEKIKDYFEKNIVTRKYYKEKTQYTRNILEFWKEKNNEEHI